MNNMTRKEFEGMSLIEQGMILIGSGKHLIPILLQNVAYKMLS